MWLSKNYLTAHQECSFSTQRELPHQYKNWWHPHPHAIAGFVAIVRAQNSLEGPFRPAALVIFQNSEIFR